MTHQNLFIRVDYYHFTAGNRLAALLVGCLGTQGHSIGPLASVAGEEAVAGPSLGSYILVPAGPLALNCLGIYLLPLGLQEHMNFVPDLADLPVDTPSIYCPYQLVSAEAVADVEVDAEVDAEVDTRNNSNNTDTVLVSNAERVHSEVVVLLY